LVTEHYLAISGTRTFPVLVFGH